MRRILVIGCVLLATAGCVAPANIAEGPPPPPPPMVLADGPPTMYWTPQSGKVGYGMVFETVLSTLVADGFTIREANRFDGRIETEPKIAPGLERYCVPGSPSLYERMWATNQSVRHRVMVRIQEARESGTPSFFVHVVVFRELEDLPRPVRSTAGAAVFQTDNNVDRRLEVADPTIFESNWIPRGRDISYEQRIVALLKSQI